MPYFHVIVLYRNGDGQRTVQIAFGLPAKMVRELIATPYMKNKAFMFGGLALHPSSVEQIHVFLSEEWEGKKFILPNGKPATEETDGDYLLKCFQRGEVKGINNVTPLFITSPPEEKPIKAISRQIVEKKKVFIVHGRDEKQPLILQKFLKDKLKVDAVMFDDLPDKGRTIIEQLEYIRDNVGYAFVIVTPDDVGCLTEDIEEFGKMVAGLESVKAQTIGKMFELFHTRARQNVVFELGLFMGALGRKKVCCLLKQDTEERPSDIDGILYKPFNKSVSEIFHEIPEELTEAGYEIKS